MSLLGKMKIPVQVGQSSVQINRVCSRRCTVARISGIAGLVSLIAVTTTTECRESGRVPEKQADYAPLLCSKGLRWVDLNVRGPFVDTSLAGNLRAASINPSFLICLVSVDSISG